MDAAVSVQRLVLEKASQVGATIIFLCGAYYLLLRGTLSAGVAYFFPTDRDLKDLSKTKAFPLLERSYMLRHVGGTGKEVYTKRVGRSWIYFRGTKSTIRVKSFTVDMVCIDEADEVPIEAQKMAEQRMHARPVQWLRHFSKPSVPSYGIDRVFQQSDRRYWTIRCRGCRKEFAFEDKDAFPACITFRGNKAIRCCPRCRKEVRIEDGRWVARNPQAKTVGYHLSQMLSPTVDPGDLLTDFESTDRVAEFWRGRLGVAYVDSAGNLEEKEVLDLCRDEPRVSKSKAPTYMGVDIGRVLHWLAITRDGYSLKIVGMGEERTFEALRERMHEMNVQKAVLDALPETHAAIRFSEAMKGRVWLSYYVETARPGPPKWYEDEDRKFQRVDSNRTEQLDRMIRVFRGDPPIVLPKRDAKVEEYARHLAALVRTEETDEDTGAVTYRYVHTGPDHFAHATVYALLAAGDWKGPIRSVVLWGGDRR